MMKRVFSVATSFLILQNIIHSQNFITEKNEAGTFPVVTASQTTSIYVDDNDEWMISPAIVLQKIAADFGEVKPSYLGPPETLYKKYHYKN